MSQNIFTIEGKSLFTVSKSEFLIGNLEDENVLIPNEMLPKDQIGNKMIDLVKVVKHLISLVEKNQKERDWTIKYLIKHIEYIHCPYSTGCFDQTKKCPYWQSYSGYEAEDDSLEAWRKLVFPQSIQDYDDEIDCACNLSYCIKKAAEYAVEHQND